MRPNPVKVETREVKERAFTVRWTPVFDGGRPITSYRIDIKNKQGKHRKSIPVILIGFQHSVANYTVSIHCYCTASWDTAITTEISNPELTQMSLVDLRPAKTYNLRMFATNSMGMSEASNVLTVTTKEAGTVTQCFWVQVIIFCWMVI